MQLMLIKVEKSGNLGRWGFEWHAEVIGKSGE